MSIHGALVKEDIVDVIIQNVKTPLEFGDHLTILSIKKFGSVQARIKVEMPSGSVRHFILRLAEEL